jgi:hypothetical protein
MLNALDDRAQLIACNFIGSAHGLLPVNFRDQQGLTIFEISINARPKTW